MKEKDGSMAKYLVFASIGFELIALELVLIYLGSQLDKKYGWPGLGLAAGAMLGLVCWLVHVVVLLKQFEKRAEKEK